MFVVYSCVSLCGEIQYILCANHNVLVSFFLQDFHKDVPQTVLAKHTTVVADTAKLVASRKDSAT